MPPLVSTHSQVLQVVTQFSSRGNMTGPRIFPRRHQGYQVQRRIGIRYIMLPTRRLGALFFVTLILLLCV